MTILHISFEMHHHLCKIYILLYIIIYNYAKAREIINMLQDIHLDIII